MNNEHGFVDNNQVTNAQNINQNPYNVSNDNLQVSAPSTINQYASNVSDNNTNMVVNNKNGRGFFRKHPVAIGVLIVVLFAVCIVGVSLYKESQRVHIKLNDYLVLDYSGYNGYGTVSAYMSNWEIIEDNADELGLNTYAQQERFNDIINGCINYNIDTMEDLSNGDVITITWMVDKEKIEDKYNCRIEFEKETVTITNLTEFVEYDPFEDVVVSMNGTAPYGHIGYNYSDVKYPFIHFNADKYTGLSNGDVVTLFVVVDEDFEDECIADGVQITCYEKEYTVENLPSYIGKISEIPEESLNAMKSQAEDTFNAYVASVWNNPETMKAFNYMGSYFLTLKEENDDIAEKNELVMVFEVNVEREDESFSYYYFTSFYNLMVLSDGTFTVDLSEYDIPSDAYFSDEKFSRSGLTYLGYEKLESLFSNCVTQNIEYYNYESNIP